MNIIQIAWLGERNFGDELMAQTIWDRFDELSPGSTFNIWSDVRPSKHDRVKWVYPFRSGIRALDSIWEQSALKTADAIIVGGGSILHSAASSDWKHLVVERFKNARRDKKALGIGLSIGPFNNPVDEKACARFLQSLDACSFRDRQSHAFASNLKLPYEPTQAFDLAASYLRHHAISPREDVISIDTVGLSVRLPYVSDPKRTFGEYVELAKALCAKYRIVKLFSFTGAGTQCDQGYCRKITDNVGASNLEIIRYDGNLDAFVEQLKACDFFISTKFHGIVVPYLLNVPFISISYQRKFEDFADDISLPEKFRFRQTDFEPQEIISRIEPYALTGRSVAFEAAERNFAVFDEISDV